MAMTRRLVTRRGHRVGAARPRAALPSSGSRMPGIEGLRAIAAGSVLVYHCWLYASPDGIPPKLGLLTWVMPHLSLGVILFFSLSGFLLYRPFAAAVVRGVHGPNVRSYLRNRALRILPAYWVILLVTGVALGAALLRDASSVLVVGWLADQPLTLLKNVALVQSYDPWTLLTGIGPAWSLVIEVAFYVMLPLVAALAALLARRAATRRRRRLIALLPPAALLVVGLLGKMAAHLVQVRSGMGDGWGADWYSVLARSFLANADLFAFGMALGVLHTEMQDGLVRLPRWWRHAAVAGAGAIVVATLSLTSNRTGIGDAKYDLLMTVPCGVLLAIVVLPDTGSSQRLLPLLDSRLLMAVGLASYSLFLWHEPLVHWLREHGFTFNGAGGFIVNLVVLGAVAGVASALTYRYVEVPAMARRRRQTPTDGSAGQQQAAP